MTDSDPKLILEALFRLSRDTQHISATTLAEVASVTPTRAAQALVELERAGLVDASRARLTMLGLARAMAAGAGSGGKTHVAPRPEPGRRVPVAAAPLAAVSEWPKTAGSHHEARDARSTACDSASSIATPIGAAIE